mgnify:CR=1 FL=1
MRLEEMSLPPELKALEDEVAALTAGMDEAVQNQEFERAAALRDRERGKRRELSSLRERWSAGRSGGRKGTAEDVADVVSYWTGIPVSALSKSESQRLLELEEILHRRVVGQDEAVSAVAKAIRRGRTGLDKRDGSRVRAHCPFSYVCRRAAILSRSR